MRHARPQLKSVIAVLLFWQLAGGIAAASPATGSMPARTATSSAALHCDAHGHAGSGTASTPTSSGGALPDYGCATSSVPICCQGVTACQSVCAQATPAIAPACPAGPAAASQPVRPELRSPPDARRATELFRPPI
jgi:hypothetical protein